MNVAILGCGLIGASWAALFAAVGRHRVRGWDPSPAARAQFPAKIARAVEHLRELGSSGGEDIVVCSELEEALLGSQWVQESVPEDVNLKTQLFGDCENVLGADAIMATSTSSFTWSQLAAGLVHPQRFVVAHPFNPPHLMPLVELFCPNPQTLERAIAIFRDMGRVTVSLKHEATGHIGNRLASALWREAVHLVAEGIAEVADIDKVLIHGPGLRWSVIGTHLGYHLGGGPGGIEHYLRHLGASQERRWASLGTPALTSKVRETIVQGVLAEAGERSIEELETERDRQLLEILRLRRAHPPLLS